MNDTPSFERDDLVGVAVAPGVGLGLACGTQRWALPADDPVDLLARIHAAGASRWVWWGREVSDLVAAVGIPIDRCWDVRTVHRFLHGTWKAPLGEVWAV